MPPQMGPEQIRKIIQRMQGRVGMKDALGPIGQQYSQKTPGMDQILQRPVDPATGMQAPLSSGNIATAIRELSQGSLGQLNLTERDIRRLYRGVNYDLRAMSDPYLQKMIKSLMSQGLGVRQILRDPAFMEYMGGLKDELVTGRQNMASDLAWVEKFRNVEKDSFNALLMQNMMGVPGEAVGGSGGGGGGGGYGGGGYSRYGRGGGGSGDIEGATETDLDEKSSIEYDEYFKGFMQAVRNLGGDDPERQAYFVRLAAEHGLIPNTILESVAEELSETTDPAILAAQAEVEKAKQKARQNMPTEAELDAVRNSGAVEGFKPLPKSTPAEIAVQRGIWEASNRGMPSGLPQLNPEVLQRALDAENNPWEGLTGTPKPETFGVQPNESPLERAFRRRVNRPVRREKRDVRPLENVKRDLEGLFNQAIQYSPQFGMVETHRDAELTSAADATIPYPKSGPLSGRSLRRGGNPSDPRIPAAPTVPEAPAPPSGPSIRDPITGNIAYQGGGGTESPVYGFQTGYQDIVNPAIERARQQREQALRVAEAAREREYYASGGGRETGGGTYNAPSGYRSPSTGASPIAYGGGSSAVGITPSYTPSAAVRRRAAQIASNARNRTGGGGGGIYYS